MILGGDPVVYASPLAWVDSRTESVSVSPDSQRYSGISSPGTMSQLSKRGFNGEPLSAGARAGWESWDNVSVKPEGIMAFPSSDTMSQLSEPGSDTQKSRTIKKHKCTFFVFDIENIWPWSERVWREPTSDADVCSIEITIGVESWDSVSDCQI